MSSSLADFQWSICLCRGRGGGAVVANRSSYGLWETFTVEGVTNAPNGFGTGDQIALRAINGQYVCAESGGGRELAANRHCRGPWETFTLEGVIAKNF